MASVDDDKSAYGPPFKLICDLCDQTCDYKGACDACQCVYYCSDKCRLLHAPTHKLTCGKELTRAHSDPRVGFTIRMERLMQKIISTGMCQSILEYMKTNQLSMVVEYDGKITVDGILALHVGLLMTASRMITCIHQGNGASIVQSKESNISMHLLPTIQITGQCGSITVPMGWFHLQLRYRGVLGYVYTDSFRRRHRHLTCKH